MLDRIHTKPEGTNPWPELVDMVLPKVLACNTAEEMQKQRDYRTECALQLAAAALRAIGEHTLAENLLN
ncbi:TPA: hypothetical protein ACP633_000733 [Escherichia coli]|jgi:hypothetical protein|uniref:hypothetical protein n=1 Tax=Enterobacteriaceae TaxID=543 RepID=UPI00028D3785|nr:MULTISPECIES: hypothetical protein [Enterobacteriaceae]EBS6934847.1 hypothetical protein [Salmonella enterica]EDW0215256.1 hypothetical protein [Salmonella enterica subsp. enterica]EEZ8716287.1 hypothetical protein [Escherichia coli O78]EFA8824942.1 hypothetical protein [Escherichia coli O55:H7]EFB4132785.1 hypothetical protein [Escherichia coli O8:H36]EGT5701762.1 hypothetical protein [Cronobacter sakazakii]EKX8507219.1 hypothetical protein [Citrobacter sedlakii]